MSPESGRKRFFVALLPPQNIQAVVNEIKQQFADQYDSRAAQKSPPHITLQPPFEWPINELALLAERLGEFAATIAPFSITLDGFAAFPPRVIYVDVRKSPELLDLQKTLTTFMEGALSIVDEKSKSRPFAPHMTVAFRDLTKQNFRVAWPEFQERSLYYEFLVADLTLLIHDGQRWNICQQFPFLVS